MEDDKRTEIEEILIMLKELTDEQIKELKTYLRNVIYIE